MPYRFVKITNYYRSFLNEYYDRNSFIKEKSYNEQHQHLMSQLFGWSDYFIKHLSPIISCDKNLIVDFQILLAADIIVTANSSFSWWAAHLNSNCIRVLAPKYWLNFRVKNEYPSNVIPEAWEQIEIN